MTDPTKPQPEPQKADPREARCQVSDCREEIACFGSYESGDAYGFACNTHCGHGNEDGWCFPIDGISACRVLGFVDQRAQEAREQAEKDRNAVIVKALRAEGKESLRNVALLIERGEL